MAQPETWTPTDADVRFCCAFFGSLVRSFAKSWMCAEGWSPEVAADRVAAASAPPRWTHLATEGTPLASTANSMYQPGGATLGLLVTLRLTVLPLTDSGRSTNRWLGSEEWVTAAGRISSA